MFVLMTSAGLQPASAVTKSLYIGEEYTILPPSPISGGYISNVVILSATNNLYFQKNADCSITVIPTAYISGTSTIKVQYYETFWGTYSKRKEIIKHGEQSYNFTTKYPTVTIPDGYQTITIEVGETAQLKYNVSPEGLLPPVMGFGIVLFNLPTITLSEDDLGYVTGKSVGTTYVAASPYGNENKRLMWMVKVVNSNANKLKIMASPYGGAITTNTKITLKTVDVSKSDIYYTLDGSTPSKNSTKYSSGFSITKPCTLKAIAYKDGYETSDIFTTNYTIKQDTIVLTASPSGGTVDAGTKVYLTSSVSGADIYYTLDDSEPSKNSTKYTSAGITISETTTLKAIAYKDGYVTSEVLRESYMMPPVNVTGISLNEKSITLIPGNSKQLTASIKPENATDQSVSWSSSNYSVASVDENGLVTAKGTGTATITCKAKDGSGIEATCTVNVVSSYFSVKNNNGIEINYRVTDTDAMTCLVNYISDKSSISGKLVIPDMVNGFTVTEINNWACSEVEGLTSVQFPKGLKRIGYDAFYNCKALASISNFANL